MSTESRAGESHSPAAQLGLGTFDLSRWWETQQSDIGTVDRDRGSFRFVSWPVQFFSLSLGSRQTQTLASAGRASDLGRVALRRRSTGRSCAAGPSHAPSDPASGNAKSRSVCETPAHVTDKTGLRQAAATTWRPGSKSLSPLAFSTLADRAGQRGLRERAVTPLPVTQRRHPRRVWLCGMYCAPQCPAVSSSGADRRGECGGLQGEGEPRLPFAELLRMRRDVRCSVTFKFEHTSQLLLKTQSRCGFETGGLLPSLAVSRGEAAARLGGTRTSAVPPSPRAAQLLCLGVEGCHQRRLSPPSGPWGGILLSPGVGRRGAGRNGGAGYTKPHPPAGLSPFLFPSPCPCTVSCLQVPVPGPQPCPQTRSS